MSSAIALQCLGSMKADVQCTREKGRLSEPKEHPDQGYVNEVASCHSAQRNATPNEDTRGKIARRSNTCQDDVAGNLAHEISSELLECQQWK